LHASVAPSDILAFLDVHGVSGKQVHFVCPPGGAPVLTLVISRENLHNEEHLRSDLAKRFGAGATLQEGFGAVSAIGTGINATHENALNGSAVLAEAGIEILGLATSSFRISWLVPDTRANDAVRALHAAFIEESVSPS